MSPWEVLGINHDADLRAVKRAYATRLRVTRPEDDPQGFQQLRWAYEWMCGHVQYRAAQAAQHPDADVDGEDGGPAESGDAGPAIDTREHSAQIAAPQPVQTDSQTPAPPVERPPLPEPQAPAGMVEVKVLDDAYQPPSPAQSEPEPASETVPARPIASVERPRDALDAELGQASVDHAGIERATIHIIDLLLARTFNEAALKRALEEARPLRESFVGGVEFDRELRRRVVQTAALSAHGVFVLGHAMDWYVAQRRHLLDWQQENSLSERLARAMRGRSLQNPAVQRTEQPKKSSTGRMVLFWLIMLYALAMVFSRCDRIKSRQAQPVSGQSRLEQSAPRTPTVLTGRLPASRASET